MPPETSTEEAKSPTPKTSTPETPAAPKETPTPEKPPAGPVQKGKKPGKWFQKIPRDILLSPGGMVLLFFALGMEIIDLIPGLGADTMTWELLLEVIFMILLAIVAKFPLQSMIIPFIIERIPGISDVIPSWILKFFI